MLVKTLAISLLCLAVNAGVPSDRKGKQILSKNIFLFYEKIAKITQNMLILRYCVQFRNHTKDISLV